MSSKPAFDWFVTLIRDSLNLVGEQSIRYTFFHFQNIRYSVTKMPVVFGNIFGTVPTHYPTDAFRLGNRYHQQIFKNTRYQRFNAFNAGMVSSPLLHIQTFNYSSHDVMNIVRHYDFISYIV